jgi:hypothetical protein
MLWGPRSFGAIAGNEFLDLHVLVCINRFFKCAYLYTIAKFFTCSSLPVDMLFSEYDESWSYGHLELLVIV